MMPTRLTRITAVVLRGGAWQSDDETLGRHAHAESLLGGAREPGSARRVADRPFEGGLLRIECVPAFAEFPEFGAYLEQGYVKDRSFGVVDLYRRK